jgi:tetratricopeptide (TPR) repeat protein
MLVRALALLAAAAVLTISGRFALKERDDTRGVTELFSAMPLRSLSATEPLSSSQLLKQGDAAFSAGKLARAAEQYRAAWERDADERAVRKLFSVLLLREEYAEAEEILSSMERAKLPEGVLRPLRGLLQLHRGDAEKAIEFFSALLPDSEGFFGLALMAMISADHEGAQRALAEVLSRTEDPLLRENARRLQDAYEEFSLFQDGKPVHLLVLLARALAQNGEYRLALQLLESAVALDPQYRDAWIILGYSALAVEEKDRAVQALETALRLDPIKPEVQELLASAYAAQGDLERAYMQMRFALVNKVEPELPARLKLIDYARRIGRFEEALQQYEVIFSLPGAEIAHMEEAVGIAIDELRQPERASLIAKRALGKMGEGARVFALLGWVALAEDRLEEARALLDRAVSEDSALGSAWYRLGLVEERLGETAAALGAYRQAYDVGLASGDIRSASLAAERYNALITSP